MIICSNCGTENREGSLFCDNCGVGLTAISVGTSNLEGTDELGAGGSDLSDESIIFLHIQDIPDPVTIRITDALVLGRTGGEDNVNPHLNLDTYGGSESGVSRRHAMLTRDGNNVYITDLGSTNHTFVNGNVLEENTAYMVYDGDTVRLGHLDMRMFFK